MNRWYYAVNKERKGPVDEATLLELASSGTLTSESLVWREGMGDWQPFRVAVGDHPPAGEIPPQQSIQLGGQTVTEATKDKYVQRLREGVATTGKGWRYGGFWIRFAALMIDGVFTTIAAYAIIIPLAFFMGGTLMSALDSTGEESLGLAFFFIITGISIAIPAGYYTLTTGSKMQATFGKKLVGLRVICEDGSDVTYGRALGRYFGYMLGTMIFCLGLIMAAFDDQKRALHDHLCKTRVIER